jgi:hypothetical protein
VSLDFSDKFSIKSVGRGVKGGQICFPRFLATALLSVQRQKMKNGKNMLDVFTYISDP